VERRVAAEEGGDDDYGDDGRCRRGAQEDRR
jgi:hypothetical protein